MSMITLANHREMKALAVAMPLPTSRVPIAIRQATPGSGDIKFIDDLQRKHAKMVGWFPTKQLETYVTRGHVLVAEGCGGGTGVPPVHGQRTGETPVPLGYCISCDRYFKRDDVGIIYQLNVAPAKQRGLIGAALIKAVFERAAYGCKLFCCWCAQDLEANHFWESIGFVPLAFRTGARKAGSKKEPRIHIFWQRRIREGDTETPYWFPAETTGGAVRENRLVLPIPPGMHWSDAKPSVLPGAVLPGMENVNQLPASEAGQKPREKKPRATKAAKPAGPARAKGGLWFAPPAPPPGSPQAKAEKPKEPKQRFKNDPKYVAAARELRDKYLEQVNSGGEGMLPAAHGKYDVSRQLEAGGTGVPPVLSIGTGETPVPPLKLRPPLAGPDATGKLAA